MIRSFARVSCVAIWCSAAFSQPTASQPTFEAADVHLSAHTANPFMKGPFGHAGRYELRTATMVDLIRTAYGVDADRVVGGPSWLEMDRFDVTAKLPPRSTPDTRRAMLQALLADRFKLVFHNDTRQMPVYAMTAGKRPQLKKAAGTGDTGCQLSMPGVGQQAGPAPVVPMFSYTCQNMTMAAFAKGMRDMALGTQYLNGNAVVDQTGLEGSWDFSFKYSLIRRGPAAAAAGEVTTLIDAVEKQLGLKLELTKVPLAVIVVDSVNQKPTANLPGVTESLRSTAPPTEFEVANVKPSDPESKSGGRFDIQPGGRVVLRGMTLQFLIQQAWSLTNDMLVGAPKWLDTDEFDIVAKAFTGPAEASEDVDIDMESIWIMFRALLAERFKLATHTEERPVPAYTLFAGKPKMKKADPASRSKCQEGPAPDQKDPRLKTPTLSRLITCQNISMAQFAERLQSMAAGYIRSPILDSTELEGGWDFTLSFSPVGMVRGGGGRGVPGAARSDSPAPAGDVLAAAEPIAAISLFDALDKQLGLKLELQKRPATVLVIDHIEQKPTEN